MSFPRPTCRAAGLTLLEMALAAAVLTMALIPVINGVRGLALGFRKTTESTHAAFLAQAIIEGIRYRLYDRDARFYKLTDSEDKRREAVERRDYERFFRGLAETEGARIVGDASGGTSQYFLEFENLQGSGLHGISQATNPQLHRALSQYSARVSVSFELPDNVKAGAGTAKPPVDLAEIHVAISWKDSGNKPHSMDFSTILTRYQYEPYVAP